MAETQSALPRPGADGASAHDGRVTAHPLGIVAIAASALMMLLTPLVSYPGVLRVPAGLVLTMIGPGYAGLALLRPRLLTPWLHAALSLPLSFAVVILYSAVLDRTPGGVGGSRVTVGVALITLALLVCWRLAGRPSTSWAAPRLPRLSFGRMAIAASLAVALAWGMFSLLHAARVDPTPRYTALSASQSRTGAGNPGGTSTLTLDVVNHEGATKRYLLTVLTEAAANRRGAGISQSLNLRPGQRWTRALSVPCAGVTRVSLGSPGARPIARHLLLRPACR